MKRNPFKLNAYDALRNPDSIPLIMKRALANLMLEMTTGKTITNQESKQRDPGTDHERFLSAFNIISTQFTRNGIIKGRQGTLELTGAGMAAQDQLPRKDTLKRRKALQKRRKMPAKERLKKRPDKKWTVTRKLAFLDRIMDKLREDLSSGRIEERQH